MVVCPSYKMLHRLPSQITEEPGEIGMVCGPGALRKDCSANATAQACAVSSEIQTATRSGSASGAAETSM